jgi:hypothetical protein
MAIQGLRNTTSFDTPNGRRPQNFREGILMMYPNSGDIQKAPLTALTAVMKSESTNDPVFHWFTKQLQDRRLKLAADLPAVAAGAAGDAGDVVNITIDPNFSKSFSVVEGTLLMVEQTNEILYVNATPSAANTISVIRGFTQAAGSAVVACDHDAAGVNPYLVIIGTAFEEGSAAPDSTSFDPIELFNQTQIFRGTYGITGTAAATKTRTGSEAGELKREGLENFSIDMERGLWFGKKTTTVRNGQPLRTTDGVLAQIPNTQRWAPPGGAVTYDWLVSKSRDIFRYGSSEKMAFIGGTALTAIAEMVRKNGDGQYQLSDSVSEYGMKGIRRLHTPTGTLVLKVHPLFSQMVGGTTAGTAFTSMDNAMVILDMAQLKYRYLEGRDVMFQKDLQLPGVDAKRDGWIGEAGLELHHPFTHSIITGIVSGAKDA